jgi:hypothetical protein
MQSLQSNLRALPTRNRILKLKIWDLCDRCFTLRHHFIVGSSVQPSGVGYHYCIPFQNGFDRAGEVRCIIILVAILMMMTFIIAFYCQVVLFVRSLQKDHCIIHGGSSRIRNYK